jgi:hypothetical protein
MAFISNGTTILDNGAFTASLGGMVLIKEQTASSSSSVSFVDGSSSVVLDSTYPIYKFEFINIHPSTDAQAFTFNLSIDSGSNYNVTKTSTFFQTYHTEGGASGSVSYEGSYDLAQSTSDQQLIYQLGNDNDQCVSGHLFLFNPSSTTFVKHFLGRCSSSYYTDANHTGNYAGYGNTTSAIDGVRFKMSSGNIDSGTIKLYGIKDS